MRVDVHTHIWPDRIAGAVAENMETDLGFAAIAANTVDGIKAHMAAAGVDKSIVLGVAARAGGNLKGCVKEQTVYPLFERHGLEAQGRRHTAYEQGNHQ